MVKLNYLFRNDIYENGKLKRIIYGYKNQENTKYGRTLERLAYLIKEYYKEGVLGNLERNELVIYQNEKSSIKRPLNEKELKKLAKLISKKNITSYI